MLNHRLWRRLIILAAGLFLGGLVFGGILMPRTAFTHATTRAAKAAATQCSQATLQGTYVFAVDGVQIVGRDRVPFALAGWATFDGRGHLHAIFSLSANGKITRLLRLTGTYTVRPDCTATETDTDVTGAVTHYDDFTTPDGSLASFVQTDPGVVSSGVGFRGTGKRVGN
jgi:hypothetical protein